MRVLVFETDHGGHRLHHVSNILIALREIGQEVTVALSQQAPSTAEFAVHLSHLSGQANFDAWIPPLPRGVLKSANHRAQALRESIRRARAEWLYVPCADSTAQILGVRRTLFLPTLPRGLPAEGLILRGGFAYPQGNWKQAWKARFSWAGASRAAWTVMHLLDPIVHQRVIASPRMARWCRLMPDPVEIPPSLDRTAARASLALPVDGRYIGCVGIIDGRKGVDLLIRGFAKANLGPRDRLLLAGQHDPEIRALLAGPFASLIQQGRIISIDQTLETGRFVDAVVASDLVCALYPRHIGSASIAIRAAAAHRPTLAHNFGWLGAIVPRFDLGWTCNALDDVELAEALPRALDRATGFTLTAKAQRYVAFNSIDNFRASWTRELREHLGLGPGPGYHPWEWVTEAAAEGRFHTP